MPKKSSLDAPAITQNDPPVAVIGGGLAGLLTALELLGRGCAVHIFERSRELGGRARSPALDDVPTNLGPRAVYRRGELRALLDAHNIRAAGGKAKPRHTIVEVFGELRAFPTGGGGLLAASWLTVGDRFALAQLLARAGAMARRDGTCGAVLDGLNLSKNARALVEVYLRTATYAPDPGALSATIAFGQLARAGRGVDYLDGGWAALGSELAAAVTARGGVIETGAPVGRVSANQVVLKSGRVQTASAIAIALPLDATIALCARSDMPAPDVGEPQAVVGSTLDIIAERSAEPTAVDFAASYDDAMYLSVHSKAAKLCDDAREVVHVMSYGRASQPALTAFLHRVRPSTRVIAERYLPHMVVTHRALVPDTPAIDRIAPGVFVTGAWASATATLADGAAERARAVAALIADVPNTLRRAA